MKFSVVAICLGASPFQGLPQRSRLALPLAHRIRAKGLASALELPNTLPRPALPFKAEKWSNG